MHLSDNYQDHYGISQHRPVWHIDVPEDLQVLHEGFEYFQNLDQEPVESLT